jgi:hypothetical protein
MAGRGAAYWRVYNVLVRALGLSALLSGLFFIVWGIKHILELGLLPDEGAGGLMLVVAGLLAAGIGAALLRTPTYRPDLGDVAWHFDPFGAKPQSSTATKRSWWTGDR